MDDFGLPVRSAATERALFGSLPSAWLQGYIYMRSPALFSWAVAVVHASWFVVPWLIALLVTWRRPHRLGSFFLWWFALHFSVNPFFAVFPLEPPWMADAEVVRIVAVHTGSGIPDRNPLASIPSLHVALPLLLSFWFLRERWKIPAWGMLAYAALIAFEVVLAGEHYVIDLIGAAAVAGAIALAARIDYRRALSRLRARLKPNPQPSGEQGLPPGPDPQVARRRVPVGLTTRPAAIFAVAAALIVLVSFRVAFSGSAPDHAFTSDMLDPPGSLTARGGSSIALSWESRVDGNAEGYRVLRGTASGGPYVEVAEVTPWSITSFTDNPPAGTYFYVVRSFFENSSSVNSNEVSATRGVNLRAELPP
jgi:membrane-associated phospholipid phosphatase